MVTGEPAVRPVRPGTSGTDAAIDDEVFMRASPQLALLPRYPVLLRPTDTALGTTSRQLVLNSDVLTPGMAYFAKVSAFHKRMLFLHFCLAIRSIGRNTEFTVCFSFFLFVCTVTDFSAGALPIGVKFYMAVQPHLGQVFSYFGG